MTTIRAERKPLPAAVRRRVRELQRKGHCYRVIAERVGISQGSVSHILAGRCRPTHVVEEKDVGSKPPAIDAFHGLRPGLIHGERWAEPGQLCENGHRLLILPCRQCRADRLDAATLAARRIGLALDRALVRNVLGRVAPEHREAVETLVEEYRLIIWRLGAPGAWLENQPLVEAHARIRRLLELVATGAWNGIGPAPAAPKRQDNRGVRPGVSPLASTTKPNEK